MVELSTAVLILLNPVSREVGLAFVTLSFLVTTPEAWVPWHAPALRFRKVGAQCQILPLHEVLAHRVEVGEG